jgi:hypothetical protein
MKRQASQAVRSRRAFSDAVLAMEAVMGDRARCAEIHVAFEIVRVVRGER